MADSPNSNTCGSGPGPTCSATRATATKSRAYSTTYGQLRADRAEHARALAGGTRELFADWDNDTTTEAAWRFLGTGHDTPAQALIAAGIAEDLAMNRETAREERGA